MRSLARKIGRLGQRTLLLGVALALIPICVSHAAVAQKTGAQGKSPPPTSAPLKPEKETGALELGDLYERWGDEQAQAEYAQAATSPDPAIREKALAALTRLHREYPWEGPWKRLGSEAEGDSVSIWKAVLFGLVTAAGLAILWLLVRFSRLIYDRLRWLRERERPQRIEIASVSIGSQDASSMFLIEAFNEVLRMMHRQAQLAKTFAPNVTVLPQMRATALGNLLELTFELGERAPTLAAFLVSAWNPRPRLRVDGSALAIGDQCHLLVALRNRDDVLASWAKTLPAKDVLDGLRDIAYAALLAAPKS